MSSTAAVAAPKRHPWYTVLYIQVLIAIALGIAARTLLSQDRRGDEAARATPSSR